ncbi:MAG TPA: hypothetical protein PLW48_12205 [Alphaproteobacteria bacterium]|nr:hypothetical protein [Alphaproteobacteria bacterium]
MPLEITKKPTDLIIEKEDVKDFWKKNPEYSNKKGCYIVAIRAGRGYTPIYVGSAIKQTFEKEALADRHRALYNEYVGKNKYKKGTPIIFLIFPQAKRGIINGTDIRQLEKYLIRQAINVNPGLKNNHHTKPERWAIEGVVRSKKGKPNSNAKTIRRMLDI